MLARVIMADGCYIDMAEWFHTWLRILVICNCGFEPRIQQFFMTSQIEVFRQSITSTYVLLFQKNEAQFAYTIILLMNCKMFLLNKKMSLLGSLG